MELCPYLLLLLLLLVVKTDGSCGLGITFDKMIRYEIIKFIL
jgi:hypothetical protein